MYDSHTHTIFSYDGADSADRIIQRGVEAGLSGLALTDHFDPDYPDEDTFIDLDAYRESVADAASRYRDRIQVSTGLEIGVQPGETAEKCKAAAGAWPWDFILASVHVADGIAIDVEKFRANRRTDQLLDAYYRTLRTVMDAFDDYDVLSHLNIMDRYVDRSQMGRDHMVLVKDILKTAAQRGKGIEINTSSFRYGMGDRTTPTQEMLDLYVGYGGKIITLGSDAHRGEDVGRDFQTALRMVRKAGLTQIAFFTERTPSFHFIDSEFEDC
jgi:histidinol-phosphatase (PHP family)